jgi:hypothetical protein
VTLALLLQCQLVFRLSALPRLVALGDKCRFITHEGGDDRQLQIGTIAGTPWMKSRQGINKKVDVVADAAEIHRSFVLVFLNVVIP